MKDNSYAPHASAAHTTPRSPALWGADVSDFNGAVLHLLRCLWIKCGGRSAISVPNAFGTMDGAKGMISEINDWLE